MIIDLFGYLGFNKKQLRISAFIALLWTLSGVFYAFGRLDTGPNNPLEFIFGFPFVIILTTANLLGVTPQGPWSLLLVGAALAIVVLSIIIYLILELIKRSYRITFPNRNKI